MAHPSLLTNGLLVEDYKDTSLLLKFTYACRKIRGADEIEPYLNREAA